MNDIFIVYPNSRLYKKQKINHKYLSYVQLKNHLIQKTSPITRICSTLGIAK